MFVAQARDFTRLCKANQFAMEWNVKPTSRAFVTVEHRQVKPLDFRTTMRRTKTRTNDIPASSSNTTPETRNSRRRKELENPVRTGDGIQLLSVIVVHGTKWTVFPLFFSPPRMPPT